MQVNNNIAFFDFCETLVNFQTADAFVDYVRSKTRNKRMKFLEVIRILLKKIRLINYVELIFHNNLSLNKRIKLLQLRGFSYIDLDGFALDYYMERIKPNLIEVTNNLLKVYQHKGYEIVLVSGGYDIYLKYYAKDNGINTIISSKLQFCGGKSTGRLSGKDCLRKNKVEMLDKLYPQMERMNSVSFSDSITDLPFLKWTRRGVVVSRSHHKEWVEINKLEEIIW